MGSEGLRFVPDCDDLLGGSQKGSVLAVHRKGVHLVGNHLLDGFLLRAWVCLGVVEHLDIVAFVLFELFMQGRTWIVFDLAVLLLSWDCLVLVVQAHVLEGRNVLLILVDVDVYHLGNTWS